VSGSLPLRSLAWVWVLVAFATGLLSAGLWFHSERSWQAHLNRSELAGVLLYNSLLYHAPLPRGVTLGVLRSPESETAAVQGGQPVPPDVRGAVFSTNVSILDRPQPGGVGEDLRLVILSDNMRYAVSDLVAGQDSSPAAKLGKVTQLLARYCSRPRVFARIGAGQWRLVTGDAVWSCDAAPNDLRLPAVILALVALMLLLSQSAGIAARFESFARTLRQDRRFGAPDNYSSDGPAELRDIVDAVNGHLEKARTQLSKRAAVLSGVSHDLGTPATRLRLRAALISDQELRGKLEADIDSMTGMIESVLTYTRSEMSVEEPRQISLQALVEAVVADYQDLGRPVDLAAASMAPIQGGASLFSARAAQVNLTETRRILVTARPILLERALCNLIDNALKYGRRAHVSLEANSEMAVIEVEDEGSELDVAEIERVLAPFRRGANTGAIDGFGLGLTIVATVAEQHGGSLHYEMGQRGLRAQLEICRQ